MLLLPNPLKSLFFGFSGKHLVLNSSLPSNKLTKAAKKQFFSFVKKNDLLRFDEQFQRGVNMSNWI